MLFRRISRLAVLLAILALGAGCAAPATPGPGAGQSLLITRTVEYRMVPVKTSTPRPDPGATATIDSAQDVSTPAQALSPAPRTPPTQTPAPPSRTPPPDPRASVVRVDQAQARDQAESGRAVLVDVRSAAAYQQTHAAGALSLPTAELNTRYQELPRDRLIILYCA